MNPFLCISLEDPSNIHDIACRMRSYTREFAMKMVEVGDAMMTHHARPCSSWSNPEAELLLQAMWIETPDLGDTWEDAKLRSVARYLLGARGLKVPKGWEWILPTSL